MKKSLQKSRNWLLPVTLILLILTGVTFPWVAGVTYSWRSESPDHTLTYTPGQLTWDKATGIRADGSAELSLFQAVYQNVNSEDEEKVVAPGTQGENTIRLISDVTGKIHYTALVYQIKTNDALPISVSFTAEGASAATNYALPDAVEQSQIIGAVQGTLEGKGLQEFTIDWIWNYEEGQEEDLLDTALGDKAAFEKADDILLGFTIVVEDDNSYVKPAPPKTGDTANVILWAVLAGASLFMLFLLLFIGRRKREEEQDGQAY